MARRKDVIVKMRSSIIRLGVLTSVVTVFASACGSDKPPRGPDGGTGGSAAGGNPGGGANPLGGAAGSSDSAGAGNSPGAGAPAGGTPGVGTGGAGPAGAPPNGGAGGGVAPGGNAVGLPCQKDTDCRTGLTCLTSAGNEFDGGGVPNGVCSLDCSADINATTATTCNALGPTIICLIVTDTKAYCVESCNIGPPVPGQAKCHNRRDMACADPGGTGQGVGYCAPTCRGDFDCAGRTCDLDTGVCTDPIDPARKLPIGAKCDPRAMTNLCSGACVGVSDGPTATIGFCSGTCRLSEIGCGISPSATGPKDAFCLFPADPRSDVGDLGFCAETCDCNDDCGSSDFVCAAVPGLSRVAGHVGACSPPDASADGGLGIPCRDQ
jgi:hypothetical protein